MGAAQKLLEWLLETDLWIPRREAGAWTTDHMLASMTANALIFAAFFSMFLLFVTLLWQRNKSEIIKSNQLALILLSMIYLLAGVSRLSKVFVFYWPAYRLFTLLDIITGVMAVCGLPMAISLIAFYMRKTRMLLEVARELQRLSQMQDVQALDSDIRLAFGKVENVLHEFDKDISSRK